MQLFRQRLEINQLKIINFQTLIRPQYAFKFVSLLFLKACFVNGESIIDKNVISSYYMNFTILLEQYSLFPLLAPELLSVSRDNDNFDIHGR